MRTRAYIKRLFIRQQAFNDCGLACLAMIFKYAGLPVGISKLASAVSIPPAGISLLDLKKLANGFGLDAHCVQMDNEHLLRSTEPCILHVLNDYGQHHFEVFFGRSGNRFLMADPSRQVHYVTEEWLHEHWASKAALYFVGIDPKPLKSRLFLRYLLKSDYYPKGLFIIVPSLTLFAASFSVALTGLLQKGIDDKTIFNKYSLTVPLVLLLFIISFSKTLFLYLRHYLLMQVGLTTNRALTLTLFENFKKRPGGFQKAAAINPIKTALADIQKIQHSYYTLFATFLSDGSLILLISLYVLWMAPLAGLITLCVIAAIITITVTQLPDQAYANSALSEMSALTESSLIAEAGKNGDQQPTGDDEDMYRINHDRFLSFARTVATKAGKVNLIIEALATMNVMAVFYYSLVKLQRQELAYANFMIVVILTYVAMSLLPKLCNGFSAILEGADAYLQHSSRFDDC